MDIETAIQKIIDIEGISLGKLFNELQYSEVSNGKINKGYAGQLLLIAIGLPLDSKLLDLEDGEIKSTILKNDLTREWIPITSLTHLLDDMANDVPWEKTKVFEKLSHFLLVPCVKETSNWEEWHFTKPIEISFKKNPDIFIKFKEDYDSISSAVKNIIVTKGTLHTTNGPNYYLQIRTKDNKPYKPLVYRGQILADKKHAIGMTTRFVRKLVNDSRGTTSPKWHGKVPGKWEI